MSHLLIKPPLGPFNISSSSSSSSSEYSESGTDDEIESGDGDDESESGDEDDEIESGDNRRLALPNSVLSESEESGEEWEVITLDDDDEDKKQLSGEMVCFRCPTQKLGTIRDKKKYLIHIERHVFGDHFVCPTCRRPFVTFSYCISHEIIEHGTNFSYDKINSDKMIALARSYARKNKLERLDKNGSSQTSTDSSSILSTSDNITSQANGKTDESDYENPVFYDSTIVSSTCLYPYRGPPVQHMVEAYEIQLNHSRQKYSRANITARLALDVHAQNVRKGYDICKVGRFSKATNSSSKKNATSLPPIPTARKSLAKSSARKRPRVIESDEDESRNVIKDNATSKPKPTGKRKIIRYQYMTDSSSESDDSEDSDYKPASPTPKRRRLDSFTSEKTAQPTNPSGRRLKEKGNTTATDAIVKYYLNPLIERVCRKCNYMWKTEADLRVHRDSMHPTLPLADLMAVQTRLVKRKSKSSNANVSGNKKSGASTAKKKTQEKAKRKSVKKKKTTKPKLTLKSNYPAPDSTFTKKEIFLYSLGLGNRIRLHTHLNKPLKDLVLPKCYVKLDRLDV